ADRLVDTGQVLVHDPAGPHVRVPDLGVAHLPGRQADRLTGGDQLGVRVAGQQPVEHRLARHGDGVVPAFGADPEAVEHDQDERGHAAGNRARMAALPAYFAPEPSASSILSSWLYLATRSLRLADPV